MGGVTLLAHGVSMPGSVGRAPGHKGQITGGARRRYDGDHPNEFNAMRVRSAFGAA
jgi:hypothetical protein